jgi:hypothetical protein
MPVHLKTIAREGLSPSDAYARLRGHVPARSSFLLENVPGPEGRAISIVGYRARNEFSLPAGSPGALIVARDAKAAEADGVPATDAATPTERLAALLTYAQVGFVSWEAAYPSLKIDAHPGEARAGRFMSDMLVCVLDQDRVVIGGRTQGACERLEHELSRPKVLPPEPVELADVVTVEQLSLPTEEELSKLSRKLEQRLELLGGERAHVHLLARTAQRGADALVAYRALGDEGMGFYVEQAESPMAEKLVLFGRSPARVGGGADGATLLGPDACDAAATALFDARFAGSPDALAARLARVLRDVEPFARYAYGGLVGFALPGGGGLFVRAAPVAMVVSEAFELGLGADLAPGRPDGDAAGLVSRALAGSDRLLRAVQAAIAHAPPAPIEPTPSAPTPAAPT